MSLKIEFVERAMAGEKIAPLCREYGITRPTGHKWVKRFKELGYDGLEEHSRRPTSNPLSKGEEVVLAVLDARDAHPRWGPKKLAVLLRRSLEEFTPHERTIARILKRANRVRERRKKRAPSIVEQAPQASAMRPNDVWTVDFKGWWKAENGERCEPLTVRDAFSRFVLTIRLCRTTYEDVRGEFERLFRRHGIPGAIQCDNGGPFVSVRSRAGISRLSAWWIGLGIRIVRSRPGCPQDNGGHERMHRDVKGDVQLEPATDRVTEQRKLDKWRQEFNQVRPHQALGGKTPSEAYKPTARKKERRGPYSYPARMARTRVFANGNIRYQKDAYFLSVALAGHTVGVEEVDELHVRVWFCDIDLGLLEIVPAETEATVESLADLRRLRQAAKSKRSSRRSAHDGQPSQPAPRADRRQRTKTATRKV